MDPGRLRGMPGEDISRTWRRIMIIGSPGSGKSTVATAVSKHLGLPAVHIDKMFWASGWQQRPSEETRARIASAAAGERWVFEGNNSPTFALRASRADFLIFLDYPRMTCIRRVLRRIKKWRGRTRPDMTPGCPERLSLPFLHFIWMYPHRGRRKAMRLLEETQGQLAHVILRNDAEVADFLDGLGHDGSFTL